MKYLLSAFVLISLYGCAAETKTYGSSISKHPVFLVVKPDGSYLIEQHFKYTIHETGRWWELEESILALLPDDPAKQAQFALVNPDLPAFG